jgi:hypothetical protein
MEKQIIEVKFNKEIIKDEEVQNTFNEDDFMGEGVEIENEAD